MKSVPNSPKLSTMFLIFASVAALGVFLRFLALSHDPPFWMPEAFFLDGGWWASGARGKIMFGQYVSQDFGMGYILTPLYAWALRIIYGIFGIGQVQTNALSALSQSLTILLTGYLVYKQKSIREAVVAVLLLSVSPFFWGHGRVSLPESFQGFFILSSVVMWFTFNNKTLGAFFAGLLLALSVLVKLNALVMGVIPLSAAALTTYLLRKEDDNVNENQSNFLKREGIAIAGFFCGMLLYLIGVIFRHCSTFLSLLFSESSALKLVWHEKLFFPARILVSKEFLEDEIGPYPVIWRFALWSPTLTAVLWFYLLTVILEWRRKGRDILKTFDMLELFCFTWAAVNCLLIFLSGRQADYRFIAPFPAFAVLCSVLLTKRWRTVLQDEAPSGRFGGRLYRFVLWAVFLLPVMIILKPLAGRQIMYWAQNATFGDQPGLGMDAAGMPFVVAWLALLFILSGIRNGAEKWSRMIVGRLSGYLIALCLFFELFVLGSYFINSRSTLVKTQAELKNFAKDGETVAGRLSAPLFFTARVNTVRRIHSSDSSDFFNYMEIAGDSFPRYVVLPIRRDYHSYAKTHEKKSSDLNKFGYRSVRQVHIGPSFDGVSRYEIDILEKEPGVSTKR